MNTFQKSVNDIFSLGNNDILSEIQNGSYLNQSISEDFYSNIVRGMNKFETLAIKEDIRFFNECSLGDNFSDIISKFGKNFYILHKTASDTKVLFMTKDTEKHETKCEYHFIANKLFFASYSFTNLFNDSRNSLIRKIVTKNSKTYIDASNKALRDKNNNILLIEDNQMLKISFFNINELKEYIHK
jgi:hypothetical protein